MIEFRQKKFSETNTLGYIKRGAVIGSGLAGTYNFFAGNKNDNSKGWKKATAVVGAGFLIGAALGAGYGLLKNASTTVNRKTTVNKRLMIDVLDHLKKTGFKEGHDFTRDPKTATRMKTRVCILVSKYSDELQIRINTVKDRNLKEVTDEVVRRIPNTSNKVEEQSDRYNDIVISTISGSADAGLVSAICEKFIRSGYPVYLVEVG